MSEPSCANHQFIPHAIPRIAAIGIVDDLTLTVGCCAVCRQSLIQAHSSLLNTDTIIPVDPLVIEGALQQYDTATRSAYLSDCLNQELSLPELVQKYQIFQVGDVVYVDSWDELVGGTVTIFGIKDGMLTFVDLPGLEYSSKELFEHQAALQAQFGNQKAEYRDA